MADGETAYGADRARSFSGLLITLALHGGGLAGRSRPRTARTQPPLIVPRDFVQAEMVKLGKPRDKFWLPRVTQPPQPTAPPDAIKLAEDPERQGGAQGGAATRGPEDLEGAASTRSSARASWRRWPSRRARRGLADRLEARARRTRRSAISTWPQVKGMLLQNYNLPAGIDARSDPDAARRSAFASARDGTLAGHQADQVVRATASSTTRASSAAQLTRKVPPPPEWRDAWYEGRSARSEHVRAIGRCS